MQIEPFCHAIIKTKESSLLPVLIIELPTLVEWQIKTNAFYPNQYHYPLMTYLNVLAFSHDIFHRQKSCEKVAGNVE